MLPWRRLPDSGDAGSSPIRGPRTGLVTLALLALLAACAACATLPPAERPRFVEEHVEAVYPPAPDGRVAVPQSTELLTVFTLASEPPPLGEEFPPQGGRMLVVPAGATVVVRCRYRAYADANGLLPEPAALFPGARLVRRLP